MSRGADRQLIQITMRGVVVSESATDFARARRKFAREHCLRLPGFLTPELLGVVQRSINRARFRRRHHRGFGSDLELREPWRAIALAFLLNDRDLFRAIRRLTSCGAIGSFNGSVRRAIAGPGKALSWHADDTDGRLLALTINLGRKPYAGGRLQIRRRRSGTIIQDLTNTVPGDAVILRINPGLEHRNTEIIGTAPKTAFSGWFHRRPDLQQPAVVAPELRAPSDVRRPTTSAAADIATDATLSFAYGVASKRTDTSMLLVHMLTGTLYELNATGARVCELVAPVGTARAIAAAIADEYAIRLEDAEEDVKRLLSALAGHGVLTVDA